MKYYFKWSDEYKVGIPKVDKQHKKLFGIYNAVVDAFYCKSDTNVLVTELIDYGFYHLETEERFLKLIRIDEAELHIKEHSDFIVEMSNVQKREQKFGLKESDMEFLLKWLKQHVLIKDKYLFRDVVKQYRKLNFIQRLALAI